MIEFEYDRCIVIRFVMVTSTHGTSHINLPYLYCVEINQYNIRIFPKWDRSDRPDMIRGTFTKISVKRLPLANVTHIVQLVVKRLSCNKI